MLGDGYIWLLENRTATLSFESTFKFELTNLTVISSLKGQNGSGVCDMNVDLKPGESRILRFVLIDPTVAWGYKYSYSYKCMEILRGEDHLVELVKNQGELKVFNYQGKDTPAKYWVLFINESYVFLFENSRLMPDQSPNTDLFKGTFNFTLDNIKIEGELPGTNSFKLELKPGDRALRKLTRIDNGAKSRYKLSFSYCFIE